MRPFPLLRPAHIDTGVFFTESIVQSRWVVSLAWDRFLFPFFFPIVCSFLQQW